MCKAAGIEICTGQVTGSIVLIAKRLVGICHEPRDVNVVVIRYAIKQSRGVVELIVHAAKQQGLFEWRIESSR